MEDGCTQSHHSSLCSSVQIQFAGSFWAPWEVRALGTAGGTYKLWIFSLSCIKHLFKLMPESGFCKTVKELTFHPPPLKRTLPRPNSRPHTVPQREWIFSRSKYQKWTKYTGFKWKSGTVWQLQVSLQTLPFYIVTFQLEKTLSHIYHLRQIFHLGYF